jgi:hypothetical protein
MHAWSVWPVALPLASVAGTDAPHFQAVFAGAVLVGVAEGEADGEGVADGDAAGDVGDAAGVDGVGDAVAVRLDDGDAVPVCPGVCPGVAPGDVTGAAVPPR